MDIAAAGIEALENMAARLADDHANAKRLAEGIAEIESLAVEPELVQTNIVFFDVAGGAVTAEQLVTRLSDTGVRILQVAPARVRAVTHYGIEADDIEAALAALVEAMG